MQEVKLRFIRLMADLSQIDLYFKTAILLSKISNTELGYVKANMDEIETLSVVLGCGVNQINMIYLKKRRAVNCLEISKIGQIFSCNPLIILT